MDEIWKDIEGYEGLYQVSNLGRVKALPKYCFNGSVDWLMKEHILKPLKIHSYTYVCLYKNKKYKRKAIHRLVALAFIPNPSNKPDIDHINAIKDDNRAVNLHWVTKTGNMNNPLTRKKISESKKGTPQPKGIDNKRSRTILQYTLDGKFIKEWHGSKEIARAFNGCNSFILKCCRGIYHQAYGYIWKFKETLSKILCKWKQDSAVSLFLYLDSVFKNKHKLIHNQAPVMNRLCPFLLNLHK